MSLDCQTKDRLERSCHLTLKQYNIILSYLNTGIKPPTEALEEADLVTALNGGINKCGKYHRLRSLASRLSLRPTDGALVFASNGKVVIPSSKFVQIIKQAHKSGGEKHLNVTQTLAKLQETYTIGRRQFGMCEDQIRDVVKSCNQGSCRNSRRKRPSSTSDHETPAKKSKPEEKDKSIKPAKQQGSQLLQSLLSVNMYQAPGQSKHTTYIPNQPAISSAPTNVLTQNNLVVQPTNVQPKLVTQNCVLVLNPTAVVVPPSSSLTDLQRFTNPPKSVNNNVVMLNPLGVGQTSSACICNLQPNPTVNTNSGPVQSAACTYNVQPQIGTNLMFLQNITTPASNSIQLIYSSNPVVALPMCTATTTSTETPNNLSSLSEVNEFIDSFSNSDKIKSPVCSRSTSLEASGDLDHLRVTDLNNNDLDLTWSTEFDLSRQTDPCMSEDEDIGATGNSQDPVIIDDSDVDSLKEENVVPFPNIWHYYQDFSSERSPYHKMCIGIQDMRLDLMKSLVGDTVSAERLKKKITYLHQLVQTEKTATALNQN